MNPSVPPASLTGRIVFCCYLMRTIQPCVAVFSAEWLSPPAALFEPPIASDRIGRGYICWGVSRVSVRADGGATTSACFTRDLQPQSPLGLPLEVCSQASCLAVSAGVTIAKRMPHGPDICAFEPNDMCCRALCLSRDQRTVRRNGRGTEVLPRLR